MNLNFNFPCILFCAFGIFQTRGIMPMMVLKYHVQKLMHVAIIDGTVNVSCTPESCALFGIGDTPVT